MDSGCRGEICEGRHDRAREADGADADGGQLDEHHDHPKFKEWCDELAQNIQWHIELYAHDWPVTGNAY